MFQAAKQLGVSIRWGADWNSNGRPREKGETDSPHLKSSVIIQQYNHTTI